MTADVSVDYKLLRFELSMYERDSNGLSLTSVQIELYFS